MFGLGFGEILLIVVVALVVLGPERLPKVAHNAGMWVGRIQNFINNVKTELSQQAGVAEFKQARDSIENAARSIEFDINRNVAKLRSNVESLNQSHTSDSQENSIAKSLSSSTQTDYNFFSPETPLIHRVSLRRQALQHKRDIRPRRQIVPKLRVRRH